MPRLQRAYNEAVLAYAGEGGLLDPARHGQTFAMCKVLGMAAMHRSGSIRVCDARTQALIRAYFGAENDARVRLTPRLATEQAIVVQVGPAAACK